MLRGRFLHGTGAGTGAKTGAKGASRSGLRDPPGGALRAVCDETNHYADGMWAQFDVTGAAAAVSLTSASLEGSPGVGWSARARGRWRRMAVAETEARVSERVDSVDFLRGVAMMALALVHSVLYFTPLNGDVDLTSAVFTYVLGDVGAALFTTLVGVSFVLSMRSKTSLPNSAVVVGAVLRGMFLLVVAMFVSLLTTGPATVFEWDVLALIAVASIVLAFLRPLPSCVLLCVAVAIVAVAPMLRGAVDYLQWWGGALQVVDGVGPQGFLVHPLGDYAPGLGLTTAVVGLIVAAWFPLFPWLAFPVIGMVLGRRITVDRVPTAALWGAIGATSLVTGLGIALAAAGGPNNPVAEHLTAVSFTPESTSLLLVQLGLVLLVMAGAHAGLDGPRRAGRWMDPIRLVGRYALTVYVLSYLVIFGVIHLADLLDRGRAHQYDITTSGWALLFGIGFVVVIVPVLAVWDRHGGAGSLEWMLGRIRLRAGVGATPQVLP